MTEIERLQMNANQANSDFVAIKGKIVEKGVEVAEGTRTAEYASKVDEVYEKGKQAQYDEFWDAYQQNENVSAAEYHYAGNGWNDKTFKPKHNIKITGNAHYLFAVCAITNLEEILQNNGVMLDTSSARRLDYAFYYASSLVTIPTINATSIINELHSTFGYATKLCTIRKLIVNENVKFRYTFVNCTALENLTIEGVIGQNEFNVQWSTKLTKDSWISIINALSATATGKSITGSLESVQKAFETSEGAMDGDTSAEWLGRISYKENWTINLI